jgi:hypothetical protein
MGYDASSGEGNTTGQVQQTQALSFAGSTASLQNAQKMEEPTYISRNPGLDPSLGNREALAAASYPNL